MKKETIPLGSVKEEEITDRINDFVSKLMCNKFLVLMNNNN